MKTRVVGITLLLVGLLFAGYYYRESMVVSKQSHNKEVLRYVAVGDSYTIGFDVAESESYSALLVEHLRSEGTDIELVENLAVTGYTTEDVLSRELPDYQRLDPHVATLLIGANDVAVGVTPEEFRENFTKILDIMLGELPEASHFVVLTIPDFTHTPRGRVDFSGMGYSESIVQFNSLIKEEAKKRHLRIVDLQDINDGIESDLSHFTQDGIHPSGKQYRLWEKRLYPEVKAILDNT